MDAQDLWYVRSDILYPSYLLFIHQRFVPSFHCLHNENTV